MVTVRMRMRMLNEPSENLFLLPFQLITLGQILFPSESLQGGEPVLIIALARIVFPTGFCFPYHAAQALGPFLPGDQTRFVELHDHGKGLGLPRLLKYGALLVSGQQR